MASLQLCNNRPPLPERVIASPGCHGNGRAQRLKLGESHIAVVLSARHSHGRMTIPEMRRPTDDAAVIAADDDVDDDDTMDCID